MTEPTWEAIAQKLRAPFNPQDVNWRPQGNPKASERCQVVCYVDARAVMDRLDEVVGAGNWAFAYEPLVIANGQVQIAKGRLTLHGVSKEDVGEASSFDPSKGCVSDALKRCAVLWGIGRYLYDVPSTWVTMDAQKRIPDAVLANLRAQLPGGSGRVTDVPVESTRVVQQHRAPTPIRTAPAAKLTGPFNALADNAFRSRCNVVGYKMVPQVERLVAGVNGDRAACYARLEAEERKAGVTA